MRTFRLAIVGKHRLLCECLASMLAERFFIVGPFDDLRDATGTIGGDPPDIFLVDSGLPGELDWGLVRKLREDSPEMKLVVFGLPEIEKEILTCIEAGANGCVLKGASAGQVHQALDRALRGEASCPPQMVGVLFSRLADLAGESHLCQQISDADLTSREIEILTLVAEGLSNKEIATKLCLSLHTVKNHVHNILEKLGAQHRLEAAEIAFRAGWIPERRRPHRARQPRWVSTGQMALSR